MANEATATKLPIDVGGSIAAIAQLVMLIAKSMGQSTSDVLREVEKDCELRAADSSDETDTARAEIDADLPD